MGLLDDDMLVVRTGLNARIPPTLIIKLKLTFDLLAAAADAEQTRFYERESSPP
jgi:hypothetical protein